MVVLVPRATRCDVVSRGVARRRGGARAARSRRAARGRARARHARGARATPSGCAPRSRSPPSAPAAAPSTCGPSSCRWSSDRRTAMKRLPAVLAIAVVARMAFHAVFLPAFEGPDEPHHLARILAFARGPVRQASSHRAWMRRSSPPSRLSRAPRRSRAPTDVRRSGQNRQPSISSGRAPACADCRDFEPRGESTAPLLFSGRCSPAGGLARRLALHGPPDFEAAVGRARCGGAVLAPAPARRGPAPGDRGRRTAGVAPAGRVGGARAVLQRRGGVPLGALVLLALERKTSTAKMAALLAAGPLLKLTAIPIVVFAVVALFREGRRRAAVAGAVCSLAVFPVQWLRGWNWGGTVELNKPTPPIGEPFLVAAVGLLRSCYAFVKTTFWVGGWSLLRPPRILAVLYMLLLFLTLACCRPRTGLGVVPRTWRRWERHAAAFSRLRSRTGASTATGAVSPAGTCGDGVPGSRWPRPTWPRFRRARDECFSGSRPVSFLPRTARGSWRTAGSTAGDTVAA